MKLTKTQLNYAETRLNSVINKREREELALVPMVQDLSREDKVLLDLLNSGKVKFKKIEGQSLSYYARAALDELLEFPEDFNTEFKEYDKRNQAIVTKYENKKQEIMDQLYLSGDAESALKLIDSL
jgi:2-phospho-L-lactate guanylyltransferase (CobY/MobA/RfbA family)